MGNCHITTTLQRNGSQRKEEVNFGVLAHGLFRPVMVLLVNCQCTVNIIYTFVI